MKIKKKRLSHRVLLSLPTDVYESLSRLSRAIEKPRAEIIRELIVEQREIFGLMAEAIEKAKAGKSEKAVVALQNVTGDALIKLGMVFAPQRREKLRGISW